MIKVANKFLLFICFVILVGITPLLAILLIFPLIANLIRLNFNKGISK